MTTRRDAIVMPDWPLYLSREEAARYVGVSPSTFDAEVEVGLWPKPTIRGAKGGRITYYRPAIDEAAQAREKTGGEHGATTFDEFRARFTAAGESHPQTPRGRK